MSSPRDRLECRACGTELPLDNDTAGQPVRCPICDKVIPRAVSPQRGSTRANGRRVVLLGLVLIAIFVAILIAVAVITHRAHEARLRSVLSFQKPARLQVLSFAERLKKCPCRHIAAGVCIELGLAQEFEHLGVLNRCNDSRTGSGVRDGVLGIAIDGKNDGLVRVLDVLHGTSLGLNSIALRHQRLRHLL